MIDTDEEGLLSVIDADIDARGFSCDLTSGMLFDVEAQTVIGRVSGNYFIDLRMDSDTYRFQNVKREDVIDAFKVAYCDYKKRELNKTIN